MSVRKNERKEGKLQVLNAARELSTYIIRICSNEQVFPKKYRWTIVSKITDASVDMISCILRANSIKVITKTDYEYRRQQQQQASAQLKALLGMVQIAHDVFNLNSKKVNHISALGETTYNLLLKWVKSDRERYHKLFILQESLNDIINKLNHIPPEYMMSDNEIILFVEDIFNSNKSSVIEKLDELNKKRLEQYVNRYKAIKNKE